MISFFFLTAVIFTIKTIRDRLKTRIDENQFQKMKKTFDKKVKTCAIYGYLSEGKL